MRILMDILLNPFYNTLKMEGQSFSLFGLHVAYLQYFNQKLEDNCLPYIDPSQTAHFKALRQYCKNMMNHSSLNSLTRLIRQLTSFSHNSVNRLLWPKAIVLHNMTALCIHHSTNYSSIISILSFKSQQEHAMDLKRDFNICLHKQKQGITPCSLNTVIHNSTLGLNLGN